MGDERGLKYTWENVSIQTGGKPVITKFLQAIMNEGDEVLYPSPGYPIYESQIRYLGGTCKPYTYLEKPDGFHIDMDGINASLSSKTTAICHNNFQNPTGILSPPSELRAVSEIANSRDLMVLSDEPYFHLVYDNKPSESIASYPGMIDRTCILYTYSKSFAMTGWRLGAAIGPKWLIDIINKLNTNDEACTTHFVQYAGIEALTNPEARKFVVNMIAELKSRRDTILPLVNSIPGFHAHTPQAAFYLLVNVTNAMKALNIDSVEVFRQTVLENTGVSFCTREHFGDSLPNEKNKYVRFAYSGINVPDIRDACKALKKFIESNTPAKK